MFEKVQDFVFVLMILALSAGMAFHGVQILQGNIPATHECSSMYIRCLIVNGISEELGSFLSGMLWLGLGLFIMMIPITQLFMSIDQKRKEISTASAKRND